jgi:Carboxypeptidase regulatory-like domain
MRLSSRPLPPAGSCSIAVAIGVATIMTGSLMTALPAAAAPRASHGPDAPVAGTMTGVLTGVVRAPDGAGLARVCVEASGASGTKAAVTGRGGRYMIFGLRPGSYAVGFRDCGAPGHYMDQWYGGSILPDGAARIQVTAITTSLKPVILRPSGGMRATYRAAARRAAAGRAAAGRAAGPAAASGASISGVVRNTAGKGLAGVCVSAFTFTANSASGAGTLTGRGGHYSLPGLSRGRWEVSFANGCGGKYAPQWWKHAGSEPKATLIKLRRGSHVTGIGAKLVVGGVITGTVRAGSTSGPGLGGVCVIADGRGRAAGIEQQARTRKDGSYRMTGLGTGRYRIQFDSQCGAGGRYVGKTLKNLVSVTNGKTTKGVSTFLLPAATISGTVTAAQAATPLAGICVFVLPVSTGAGLVAGGGVTTSRPNGSYSTTGLKPGTYTVNFSGGCGNKGSYAPQAYSNEAIPAAADKITLAAGQHATGIDAAMQPGGTVTGTVSDHGGVPLGGMCVLVTSAPDAGGIGEGLVGLQVGALGPIFTEVVATGPKGGYRISNLIPGSYAVSFASGCGATLGSVAYAAQWFAPQGGNLPDWLSVRPGAVTSRISASLRRGATIAGTIRNPAGKPAKGVCATALPLSGQPPMLPFLNGGEGSASDGSYRIVGLAGGRYAVVFGPCQGQPYALTWYKGAGSSASAKPVPVADGHVTGGIDAKMSAGKAVAGTVRSGTSGAPVKAVCVVALDSGGLAVAFAITGTKGRYAFGHLASGRYALEFFPCGSRASTLANVTKPGVRVGAAPVTTASVTLPLAGAVTGTVNGGGPTTPVAGICVEATPKTGRGAPGLAVSDGHGSYQMPGLAAGTYTIQFTSTCLTSLGGFEPQWFDGQASEAQATPVGVSAGSTHGGVSATLTADGGITGTVQVSGQPAAGVCAIAYPSTGNQRPAVAETGAGGSYEIDGLAPGSYDVEFAAGCGASGYVTQWYNGAASKAAATPVTVIAGVVTQAIDAH